MIGETTDALSRLRYLRHRSSARCPCLIINKTGQAVPEAGGRAGRAQDAAARSMPRWALKGSGVRAISSVARDPPVGCGRGAARVDGHRVLCVASQRGQAAVMSWISSVMAAGLRSGVLPGL